MQTGKARVLERDLHAPHEHVRPDGTRYVHSHAHGPGDAASKASPPQHSHELVEIETRVLAKNDALAARNRAWLAERGVLALNLMSAPGAGKTTLLERTIRDLKDERPLFVLEGDQATANDGERIRAAGAPAVQVNTGTGCHLDADMVAAGLDELDLPAGAIVVIENVGNLVCPALFDVGEHRRVVILSVTEGDDKPLKYPHMFRTADVVVLNKIDLLPYVDFDVARATANARAVNPDVTVIHTSARTGEGLDSWYEWLGESTAPAGATPAS
ncbi:MAG TPA: hydrogenase nickel incorporation protein HypB [Woeseiaceae bacterium]|nr:hydrogenase nickel incorporation protein HypB [Woeseiaceae bacterium]